MKVKRFLVLAWNISWVNDSDIIYNIKHLSQYLKCGGKKGKCWAQHGLNVKHCLSFWDQTCLKQRRWLFTLIFMSRLQRLRSLSVEYLQSCAIDRGGGERERSQVQAAEEKSWWLPQTWKVIVDKLVCWWVSERGYGPAGRGQGSSLCKHRRNLLQLLSQAEGL